MLGKGTTGILSLLNVSLYNVFIALANDLTYLACLEGGLYSSQLI
jgi:hypothetical protein